MRKASLLALLLVIGFVRVGAQNTRTYTEKDYARQPLWIPLMEDTTANFFEVEKAFNTYFTHHEKPEGEAEEMGDHRKKEKYSARKQRRIIAENKLRMAVKHYEVWRQQTLPYVQDDGRILTPAERLNIWRSQQHRQ